MRSRAHDLSPDRLAWLSLRIAAASATLAVLMGGGIAFTLARFGHVRGRALLGALAGAPPVLPEVVIGVSLLMLCFPYCACG